MNKVESLVARQEIPNELKQNAPADLMRVISEKLVKNLCEELARVLIIGDPLIVLMRGEQEEPGLNYETTAISRRVLFCPFVQCSKCESTTGGAVDPHTGNIWCRTWGEFVDPFEFCARGKKRDGFIDCPWR